MSDTRYSRQTLFAPIGPAGQQLLAAAHVAVVGCGATGAAAIALLARAGVGHLTLIDRDFVEESNLQRQLLYTEADAADVLPKAEAARRHIALINSTTQVTAHIADLVPANIHALLAPAHLILDATDNFETRYLINDYAVQQSKPWIYAAAISATAATMTIIPKPAATNSPQDSPSTPYPLLPTACLSCIFPKPPSGPIETCDTAGILSTAVTLAASLQVNEALKILTNNHHLLRRTLLSFDLWSPTSDLARSEINTSTPNPACEVCALRTFTHLAGEARPHITLCGRNSVQIHEHNRPIDFPTLASRLTPHPEITALRYNGLVLRFTRAPHTLTLFADGRAIINGTTDPTTARTLYARYIGS